MVIVVKQLYNLLVCIRSLPFSSFFIIFFFFFNLLNLGLYYGAWISQQLVRDINKGEYLVQKLSDDPRDPKHTLSALGFTYDEWNWQTSSQPQFYDYCAWLKKSIIHEHPVMFVVYLLYFQGNEYDHIMPAIGIQYKDENQYDPEDILTFYNLFHDKQIHRTMDKNDLGATRKTCRKHCGDGGCIPLNVSQYFKNNYH